MIKRAVLIGLQPLIPLMVGICKKRGGQATLAFNTMNLRIFYTRPNKEKFCNTNCYIHIIRLNIA